MSTFSIDFNWQEPKDVKDDAVVVICDPTLTKTHGVFSTDVHKFLGKTLSNHIEYAKDRRLEEGKLSESQCMKSPGFGMEPNGVKVLIHCGLSEPIVKGIFEESALRFGYLNAMARAMEEHCKSIVLPVPVLIYPSKYYKRGCLVLLQSICMFIKKYPNTSIKRFSIVMKKSCVLEFLKNKWKKHGKSVSSECFMKLQAKLEKHSKGLSITYDAFKAKFFTDVNFLDRYMTDKQAEQIVKSKQLCNSSWKSPLNEIMKSPLKGGHKDDEDQEAQQSSDDEPPRKIACIDPVSNTPTSSVGSANRTRGLKQNKRKSDENCTSSARKTRTSSSSTTHTPNTPASIVSSSNPSLEINVPNVQGNPSVQDPLTDVTATPIVTPSNAKKPSSKENATPKRTSNEMQAAKRKTRWIKLRKARNQKQAYRCEKFNFNPRQLLRLCDMVEAVGVLKRFIYDEIGLVRERIKVQLEFRVGGPKEMTPEEIKRRQLCRMPIHIFKYEKNKKDGKLYEAISIVYEPLWRKFMGYSDIYGANSADSKKCLKSDKPKEVDEMDVEDAEVVKIMNEVEKEGDSDGEEEKEKSDSNNEKSNHCDKEKEASDKDQDMNSEAEERAKRAGEAALNNPAPHEPPRFEFEENERFEDMIEILDELYDPRVAEQLQEADGGYHRVCVGQVTKARKCDSDCPKMDADEAAIVHNVLYTNLERMEGPVDEFKLVDLHYMWKGQERSVYDWFLQYSDCYQGLRSLKIRYAEFATLIDIASKCDEAEHLKIPDQMKKLLELNDLSDSLRKKFIGLYIPAKCQDHHTQQVVEKKHGEHIRNFKEKSGEQESVRCDICSLYNAAKDVQQCQKALYVVMMDDDLIRRTVDVDTVDVCKMCRTCQQNLPAGALKNGFKPTKVPKEITTLNVLEQMLIEKARANMKIFYLRSITDKKTQMKGTKGALLVLPTEISKTIDHVMETLPNGSNLCIQVRTGWEKKYIVSMPKVIIALKWLKENNPHYVDIEINEDFKFTIGENVFFEKPNATQADADKLTSLDAKQDDGHLLTQDHIEEQPMQRIHEKKDDMLAIERYTLVKHRYAPISVDTKNLDVVIFPHLHPYGIDGLDAPRMTPLKFAKYVRQRLRASDRRWATNANYLCYLYGRKQQLNLTSVQGIQARVRRGTRFEDFNLDEEENQKALSSAYAKMRGFPAYWQSVKFALRSHVAAFGAPTWFLTLNPNVKGWKKLHEHYEKRMNKKITDKNIEEAIAKDPVVFARFWRRRVASIWNDVLLKKDGPLGEITHYFHRVEYQHRGTQHIHCLIWTKNRPDEDAGPETVADFIDNHVTARLPNKDTEKELHNLVVQHQSHWDTHSRTCKRPVRAKGRMRTTRCRFGFPRPVLRRTMVYSGGKNKMKIPGFTMRPYSLARTEEEKHINDYNTAILLAWEANIDLQYIPADTRDVANYVTAYTTKGEKAKKLGKSNIAKYFMQGMSKSKMLFKHGLNMCNDREVGLLEIVDDLMGHENFEFDMAHVFIPSDPTEKRQRILRPRAKLQPGSVIHESSWLDDYYPKRDVKFEEQSLYNLMTNFEVVTTSKNAKTRRGRTLSEDGENNDDAIAISQSQEDRVTDDRYHPDHELSPFYDHTNWISSGGKIGITGMPNKAMRKMKQRVGRFFLKKLILDDVKSVEDYYGRLVRVFVPWRNEETILEEYKTNMYAEVWVKHLANLKRKDIAAWNDLIKFLKGHTILQNQEAELGMRMERMKKAKEALEVDEECEETLEIQSRLVDQKMHDKNKEKLNKVQRTIFDDIINRIKDQHDTAIRNGKIREENDMLVKFKLPRKPLEVMPDPFQMFVSGTAGTGKSFLINTLADELTVTYVTEENSGLRPSVLLNAPTGIAALAINGNTIHALLGIEVVQADHKGEEEFEELTQKKFEELKFLFSNVRLIITDEISMVSNIMLSKMDRRLRSISGKEDPFGGYNVLLFGDLLQLPPVKAPHAFKVISPYAMRRIFGAVSTNANLWSCLLYNELTENMRQGDDLSVAQMFERIRTGAQTVDDVKTLLGRLIVSENPSEPSMKEIAQRYVEILHEDPCAMALFATNEEVSVLNAEVVDLEELNKMVLNAIDCVDVAINRYLERNKGRGGNRKKKPWQTYRIREVDNEKDLKKRKHVVHIPGSFCDNLMHGGLPAQLTIAVGSRVMLRRNLRISDKLVNGATGYVTEIVKNKDGEVTTIFVKFDNNTNEPWPIPRMVAKFKRNEEIMSRSQFPLVLAYGATIHKAQGLTLKNVIIRPRHIFSPGMFYVAVSRVTKITGLHLAGFDPCKITVDTEALMESNRLRDTIGLPPLKHGVWTGNMVEIFDQLGPQPPAPRLEDRRKMEKKRKQRIAFETRYNTEDVMSIIPSVTQSKYMSHDRFCETVLIAMIHLFAMMEHVADFIKNYDIKRIDSSKHALAFTAVQECMVNKCLDVYEISERCARHENKIEKVAQYVFEKVLPQEVLELFSREYNAKFECEKCRTTRREDVRRPILWIENGQSGTELSLQIEHHLEQPIVTDEKCTHVSQGVVCGGKINQTQTLGSKSPYFIVGQRNGFDSSYLPLPLDPFALSTTRFLLVGAISLGNLDLALSNNNEMEPPQMWYKNPEGGWITLSCGDAFIPEPKLELNHMHFFIMVEKPRERLKEADRRREADDEAVEDSYDFLKIDGMDWDDASPSSSQPLLQQQQQQALSLAKNVQQNLTKTLKKRGPLDLLAGNVVLRLCSSSSISNDDSSAVNAALNMFYCMSSFKRRLVENTDSLIGYSKMMSQFFNHTEKNTENFQKKMLGCDSDGDMLRRVFDKIIDVLSFENQIGGEFKLEYQQNIKSSTCFYLKGEQQLDSTYHTILEVKDGVSIQTMINQEWADRTEFCIDCMKNCLKISNIFKSFGCYHIINVIARVDQRFGDSETREPINMFGARWMIVGFAEILNKGYQSWMKGTTDWFCVFNDAVIEQVDAKTMNLKDHSVAAIILKKIEDQLKDDVDISIDSYIGNDSEQSLSDDSFDAVPVNVFVPPPPPPPQTTVRRPTINNMPKPAPVVVRRPPSPVVVLNDVAPAAAANYFFLDEIAASIALPLENNLENHCFLNTILNMLFSIDSFRRAILEEISNSSGIVRALRDLFDRRVRNVATLRRLLRPDFKTGQHDIVEVFCDLVQRLREANVECMEFHCIAIRTIECAESPLCKKETIQQLEHWSLLKARDTIGLQQLIDRQAEEGEDQVCGRCGDGKRKEKRELMLTSDYHVVCFDRDYDQRFLPFNPSTSINMHKARWHLIAFGQFIGKHYQSWIKTSKKWICLSDQSVIDAVSLDEMDLSKYGINMMVFRKIESTVKDVDMKSVVQPLLKPSRDLVVVPPPPPPQKEVCVSTTKKHGFSVNNMPTTQVDRKAFAAELALSLENNKDDCFVIVALNMLYSMSTFRSRVIRNLDQYKKGSVLRLLAEIFVGQIRDLKTFRSLLEGFETEQGDVTRVFEKIVEELLKCKEQCFEFRAKVVSEVVCSEDDTHSGVFPNEYDHTRIFTLDKTCSFETLFNGSVMATENCEKCNKKKPNSGKNKLVRRIAETNPGEYYVVSIAKNNETARIELDTRRSVTMFNKEWLLTAFGEFIALRQHYVSWIKINDKWICVNDEAVKSTCVDAKDMNIKDYGANILIFRRKAEDTLVNDCIPKAVISSSDPVPTTTPYQRPTMAPEPMEIDEPSPNLDDDGKIMKPFLLLPNRQGTICFLNAALNILYACKPLRMAIMRKLGYTKDRKKQTQLDMVAAIFKGDTLDAELLRSTLTEYSNPAHQFDASSALDTLLQKIFPKSASGNNAMWNSVAVNEVMYKTCPRCGPRKDRVRPQRQFIRFTMKKEGRFEDVLKDAWAPQLQVCTDCKLGGMLVGTKIGNSSDYLIVLIDRTNDTEMSMFYKLDRNDALEICGKNWKLEAYTEYIKIWNKKLKVWTGHYKTWTKDNDGNWQCVNDDKIDKTSQGAEDVTITMMVLKKLF